MKSLGHLKHVHIQHNQKQTHHLPSPAPSQPIVFRLPVFSISGTGIHLHLFSYKRQKHIHGTSRPVVRTWCFHCRAQVIFHLSASIQKTPLHGTTPEKPPMLSQPCLDIPFLASLVPGVSQVLGWPKSSRW